MAEVENETLTFPAPAVPVVEPVVPAVVEEPPAPGLADRVRTVKSLKETEEAATAARERLGGLDPKSEEYPAAIGQLASAEFDRDFATLTVPFASKSDDDIQADIAAAALTAEDKRAEAAALENSGRPQRAKLLNAEADKSFGEIAHLETVLDFRRVQTLTAEVADRGARKVVAQRYAEADEADMLALRQGGAERWRIDQAKALAAIPVAERATFAADHEAEVKFQIAAVLEDTRKRRAMDTFDVALADANADANADEAVVGDDLTKMTNAEISAWSRGSRSRGR